MMNGMTRRSFIGALGASAASLPMAGIALADAPALTESESGTKTVEGGEVDHKELYGSQGREGMWLDATQAELDALLLDEPEVTEDLVLPDGTVVDKRYVALRNRLNRMSEGLANDPLENSYEIIMRLWTPEEAQQFVDCPNQVWFTAFDYVKKQREKGEDISVEEAQEILENLANKRLIVSVDRTGTRWYFLLAWVDGIWETHIPEVEDISFVTGGISGSDYGTGSKYPILHVCPVSADVVEGGVISPYRDWRLIIENNTSFGIGECICRKAALTRGDAEMDGFKRDHVWKEGADGEGFIDTCMVFGQYADYFIEQGVKFMQDFKTSMDLVDRCFFNLGADSMGTHQRLFQRIHTAITGDDYGPEAEQEAVDRLWVLERSILARQGHTRDDDMLCDSVFEEYGRYSENVNEANFLSSLEEYYGMRNVDPATGQVRKSEYSRLGLDDVAQKLETRYGVVLPE